ncbi:hypothetical protein EBT31_03535 [bacterium]|nr:hypothetical protein [bacterium]NBX48693.1 hypothetical protein [bacterium]
MSLSAKFHEAFQPDNEQHVLWFKHMMKVAQQMGDPDAKINLVAEIQMNPMRVEFGHTDALEWVHIHFCLGMKYAKAVLEHKAFIPKA